MCIHMSIVCAGQEVELVSQGSPSAGAQPSQAPAPAAGQQGQQAEDEEPPPPEPIGRSCLLLAKFIVCLHQKKPGAAMQQAR